MCSSLQTYENRLYHSPENNLIIQFAEVTRVTNFYTNGCKSRLNYEEEEPVFSKLKEKDFKPHWLKFMNMTDCDYLKKSLCIL